MVSETVTISRERELQLQLLTHHVLRADAGHGGVVLVEGLVGMGKTTLMDTFRNSLTSEGGQHVVTIASGYCYEVSGCNDAYEPFKEILRNLTDPVKHPNYARLALNLIKETGPDLLALIPGLGTAAAVAKLGVQAASAVGKWSLGADNETRADLAESVMCQYMDTILALADKHGPLVLIIEDAHWSDNASAQLFSRLARVLEHRKLLLVATYRSNFLVGAALEKVRQELLILGVTEVVDLPGFTQAQVKEYIAQRYRTTKFDSSLAAWLTQLSDGSPMFIAHYLTLLEEQGAIKTTPSGLVLSYDLRSIDGEWVLADSGVELPIPRSVQEVLNQRIERLGDGERQLLEMGSVQGFQFMSLVLMALLPSASGDILRELRRIELEDHVIRVKVPEAWARRETETYSFEHTLLRQALYNQLGRLERLNYHSIVAVALENLLVRLQERGQSVPRRLLLEIVLNNRLAENYRQAAKYGLQAAQSCYLEGAFAEAAILCEKVTTDFGRGEDLQSDDELIYSQAIQILFATSEPQWFSNSAEEGGFRLTELIERAQAAALAAGDRLLEARLEFLKGRNLIVIGSLDRAVEVLDAARRSLHDIGDTFGEISALIELGHHRIGIDAASGLETLQQAKKLLDRKRQVIEQQVPIGALERIGYRLEGVIGIGEFDCGNFDEALLALEGVVAGLDRAKMYDLHAIHSNYLAQVLIASGEFARAEQVLKDAIGSLNGARSHRAVQTAYNLGLLGKPYIEWGRLDDAVQPLQSGWRKIQADPDNSILPLIANYYAELLIDPASPVNDLEAADKLLDLSIKHSLTFRFERSVVMAKCLIARLAMLQRQPQHALVLSQEAAEELWTVGLMPSVRSEEVYLVHYEILLANDRPAEAQQWLRRAQQVLESKVASIRDPGRQRNFIEKVKVSRSISRAIPYLATDS